MGTWPTPWKDAPPPVAHITMPIWNFIGLRQTIGAYVQRTSGENDPPPVYRLLRSLSTIESDRDRSATYDFLLVISSNHGPISHCFRGSVDSMRKLSSKSETSAEPIKLHWWRGARVSTARGNVADCRHDWRGAGANTNDTAASSVFGTHGE